jgi:hypothetical protein
MDPLHVSEPDPVRDTGAGTLSDPNSRCPVCPMVRRPDAPKLLRFRDDMPAPRFEETQPQHVNGVLGIAPDRMVVQVALP